MFETLILIAVFTLLTAYIFTPNNALDLNIAKLKLGIKTGKAAIKRSQTAQTISQTIMSADNGFLSQLQQQIANELSPRPTDSVLCRHHDAMIASEIQSRLAKMPRS